MGLQPTAKLNGKVIEYLTLPITTYINLTTSGQWVSENGLRPDDVRLTVLHGKDLFTDEYPPTKQEKLELMLLGDSHENYW